MKRAVAAVMLIGAVAACTRIPPARLLPTTINSLYIPIFENRSYEPGLEEQLTRLAQEEFLSDGRLTVVGRRQADVMLVGRLKKFDVSASRLGRDEFPLTSRIIAIADVALYDPADREKKKALMSWDDIDVEFDYYSDARGVSALSPDDAYEETLRRLARQIVFAVISRRPEEFEEMRAAEREPQPSPPRRILGREKMDLRAKDSRSSEPLSVDEPTAGPQKPWTRNVER